MYEQLQYKIKFTSFVCVVTPFCVACYVQTSMPTDVKHIHTTESIFFDEHSAGH